MTRARLVEGTLFAVLFCVTFEKLTWNVGLNVEISDILTVIFLAVFVTDRVKRRDGGLPRTDAALLGFFLAFLLVYLTGYFNMQTNDAVSQFLKGMVKFVLHFGLLVAGVATLARGGRGAYWRALIWFTAGLVVNGIYGIVEYVVAKGGGNLDAQILTPLTGALSKINTYGGYGGKPVNRINALTTDPNHLGVMLCIPLLALTPVYLRMRRGDRGRALLGAILAFLLVVDVGTLSRSGALGLMAGGLVLALPYGRALLSRNFLAMLSGAVLLVGAYVFTHRHEVEVVVRSRLQTGGSSTNPHTAVYGFIPKVLHLHPLFGLGLNNFSVYYEFVTGKTDWGPHSFYVALVVEGGLVGAALFAVFLLYAFARIGVVLEVGRALIAAQDVDGARVRALGWGLLAALVGTMAGNLFYLTMSFYYFYAFLLLALAAPVVFGRRLRVT